MNKTGEEKMMTQDEVNEKNAKYDSILSSVVGQGKPPFPEPTRSVVVDSVYVDEAYLNDLMRYTYEQ